MSISFKAGLALLAATAAFSGSITAAAAHGGSGNDILIGSQSGDYARASAAHGGSGNDVLLGDRGNDRAARPAGKRLRARRRGTDLEWRGMFVNPVGGWKGGGAGNWVFQGATLKIRDIITRKAGKIPGDTRKTLIVNRLVRLSPAPKRVVIHNWISGILQKPGGPTGDIHDFKYKIPLNVKPGKYQICMVIDPKNKIKETNETNNRYCSSQFWIRPRPHRRHR